MRQSVPVKKKHKKKDKRRPLCWKYWKKNFGYMYANSFIFSLSKLPLLKNVKKIPIFSYNDWILEKKNVKYQNVLDFACINFVVQLLLQVKMCVTKAKTGDGINRKSDLYTYRKSILADWSRWSLCVRIDKKENKKPKTNQMEKTLSSHLNKFEKSRGFDTSWPG